MMTELRCADCSGAIISGRAMKAGHKFWHDHHFCCSDCGSRLREAKVRHAGSNSKETLAKEN